MESPLCHGDASELLSYIYIHISHTHTPKMVHSIVRVHFSLSLSLVTCFYFFLSCVCLIYSFVSILHFIRRIILYFLSFLLLLLLCQWLMLQIQHQYPVAAHFSWDIVFTAYPRHSLTIHHTQTQYIMPYCFWMQNTTMFLINYSSNDEKIQTKKLLPCHVVRIPISRQTHTHTTICNHLLILLLMYLKRI